MHQAPMFPELVPGGYVCGRCGRELTSPRSQAAGYGPVCWRTIVEQSEDQDAGVAEDRVPITLTRDQAELFEDETSLDLVYLALHAQRLHDLAEPVLHAWTSIAAQLREVDHV